MASKYIQTLIKVIESHISDETESSVCRSSLLLSHHKACFGIDCEECVFTEGETGVLNALKGSQNAE